MSFGLDIKLSVIYKSIVLMLVALYLVRFNIGSIILALAFYFLLMLGESGSIFSLTASASKLGFLVQHITKVITPFLVFCFLLDRSWRDSQFYTKIQQVIKVNCIVFLGNMLVGFLGFGFSTYGGVVSATSTCGGGELGAAAAAPERRQRGAGARARGERRAAPRPR